MRGGDLFKPAKRKPKPKAESTKRKEDHKRYLDLLKELWQDAVNNKTNFCFFCGEYSDKMLTCHHLKGRTGDLYLDKDWMVWGHNDCHVYKYHMASIEQRRKEPWWAAFLQRLKEKDINLYEKELEKARKIEPLNPKIWDDEDFD